MKSKISVIFLSICFINMKAQASDSTSNTRNKIQEIVEIVNSSKSHSDKSLQIESIVKNLIDYDKFFSITLPQNAWTSIKTDNNDQKVIDKYNKRYVNDYFKQITDCHPLKVEFNDKAEKKPQISVLSGTYKCSNENKSINLSVSNSTEKVLDVSINNISFIQNQKIEFDSELQGKSTDEIKKILLKN